MTKFQLILSGLFIGFAILAVLAFAGYIPFLNTTKSNQLSGEVTIWGTWKKEDFDNIFSDFLLENKNLKINYVEKKEESFDTEFIESLASRVGPDMILLPQDSIIRHGNKIKPLSFDSFSERTFRDTFIDGASIYLDISNRQISGIPIYVDPLVLYVNKDMLNGSSIVRVPRFWDELYPNIKPLTVFDKKQNILKSAVALGEYGNIDHAKEIISTLILEQGNNIIERVPGDSNGTPSSYKVTFSENNEISIGTSAVRFYTQFSNPAKSDYYSWNRVLPSSKDVFIAGNLAFYFGLASEYNEIKDKNSHLNFDIFTVPQAREVEGFNFKKATFGKMMALSMVLGNRNEGASIGILSYVSGTDFAKKVSETFYVPPVNLSLLATKPNDAIMSQFYDSALIARAWLEPRRNETSQIFKTMIEDSISGKYEINIAVINASNALGQFLQR